MTNHAAKLAAALLAALIIAAPLARAGAADTFLTEPGLEAKVREVAPVFDRGRRGPPSAFAVEVLVKNRTGVELNRPFRVVVEDRRKILNADGVTADGEPFVWVCQADCSVPAGRAISGIELRLPKPGRGNRGGLAIGRLELLHFADVDGVGPLPNVRNFSGLLETLRSEMPAQTLFVSSGDNWIPGPTYAAGADEILAPFVSEPGPGRGDMALLNELGVRASAVGNHELDEGPGTFAGILAQDGTYPGAQFPYLSTNIDFSTSEAAALVTADAQPAAPNAIARSAIVEIAGEQIGLVGAASPTFPNITNTGDALVTPPLLNGGVDITALTAEIQQGIDTLTAIGVDKIVVLSHMQVLDIERAFAPLLRDADIIIGGGSNTILADDNDVLRPGDTPAGQYPELYTGADGAPVTLVNTDGDYTYLGRQVTTFDLHGRIVIDLLDSDVNGAYATDDASLETVLGAVPPADPEVDAIADALKASVEASEGNFFGFTDVYLDGRRATVRTQESNLGNLTADANLFTAKQDDASVVVSLKNGGGIRDDIGTVLFPPGSSNPEDAQFLPPAEIPGVKPAGAVSEFDIKGALRFNNGLTLLTVTAGELRALIEHGIGIDGVGETQEGRFPQVSGLRFSFNPALPIGSRVVDMTIVDESTGTVIDTVVDNGGTVSSASYRMVTLGFLAGGGDGYPFPDLSDPAVDAKDLLAEPGNLAPGVADFAAPGSEQDALAEYLAANFPQDAPFDQAETPRSEDQRIVFLTQP